MKLPNIKCIIDKVNAARNAPDALDVAFGYKCNISLFNRNNEAAPRWTASSSGDNIRFSLIDAAALVVIICAAAALCAALTSLCFKLCYRKRFK